MFFLLQVLIVVIGMIVHIRVDKSPNAHTRHRKIELALLWVIVGVGAFAILGGISHIGPTSDEIAEQIGYTQSMFQWEVGWADIGIGVLGVGCIWKRDGWLDAAVVMMAISYGGDAIGHIMEWVAHDNTADANVGAIPTDILEPLIAVILLIAYRRTAPDREAAPAKS